MTSASSPAERGKGPAEPPVRRPPGRYDEPRALPPQLTRAVTALLVVALTAGAYAVWQRASGRPSVRVTAYQVLGDQAVEVRFEVHRAHEGAVVCALRALDRDGAQVGTQDVPVQAGVTALRVTLPTSRRAAVAQVTGCSSP